MHTHEELRAIAKRCGLAGTVGEIAALASFDAHVNRLTGDQLLAILEQFDDIDALGRWADDGGRT